MREIKFKVWDKKRKKIFKVFNLQFQLKEVKIIEGNPSTFIKFKDSELIQFTGLKDKNGKEIYEGDIVKCWKEHEDLDKDEWISGERLALIEFGTWGIHFKNLTPKSKSYEDDFFYEPDGSRFRGDTEYETIEVIGNIYENPELLGEKK